MTRASSTSPISASDASLLHASLPSSPTRALEILRDVLRQGLSHYPQEPKLAQQYAQHAHDGLALYLDNIYAIPEYVKASLFLSETHLDLGQYASALGAAFDALQQAHGSSEVRAHRLIGNIYQDLGVFDQAYHHHSESQRLAKHLRDEVSELKAQANIAVIYLQTDKIEQAITDHSSLLARWKQLNMPIEEAITYVNLAEAYLNFPEPRYDIALKHAQQGHAIAQRLKIKDLEAFALIRVGNACSMQAPQKAMQCYQDAITIAQESSAKRTHLHAKMYLGQLLREQEHYNTSLDILEACNDMAHELGLKVEIYDTCLQLSQTLEKMGAYHLALERYKQFHEAKQRVFDERAEQRRQAMQVRFETEETKREAELLRKEAEINRLKAKELLNQNVELTKQMQQNTELLEQIRQLSITDSLTGIFNRRHIDKKLYEEYFRARHCEHPMSIALLDIDHFKRVNDNFSHHMGDEVLRQFVHILKDNLRQVDILGRYGGEEFIVIFFETPFWNVKAVCERLRERIEAYAWDTLHADLKVTASIGVASAERLDVHNAEDLIKLADKQLYIAKDKGRNCVAFAQPEISLESF